MTPTPEQWSLFRNNQARTKQEFRDRFVREMTLPTFFKVRAYLERRSFKHWLLASTRGVGL